MADLVDRQKVLSLPRLTHRTLSGEIVAEYISVADIEALPEEPSAEPKIIYCKECISAHSKVWLSGTGAADVTAHCGRTGLLIFPYSFCSFAIRREV